MMLLAEKDATEVKGRMVFRGDGTREWLSREDTASPTASLEAIEATCVIDAYEKRDIMSTDIPHAFIQTYMPEVEDGKERIIMKITGSLVSILTEMAPEYRNYVVEEKGKRVIYTKVLRAIYGMLQSSLLWYKQFRGDLEDLGFIFNPYDPCVANKMVNGKLQTIRFHVDDLMSSHVDKKVNDDSLAWLNKKYGEHGGVTATRGDTHDYLGMTFEFINGEVKVNMIEYVENMLKEFWIKFKKGETAVNPAGVDMFKQDNSKKLNDQETKLFHSTVAKALFLCKRAR